MIGWIFVNGGDWYGIIPVLWTQRVPSYALCVGETESDQTSIISDQTSQAWAHRLICKVVDNLVNSLCAFLGESWRKEDKTMRTRAKKSMWICLTVLVIAVVLSVACYAYSNSFSIPNQSAEEMEPMIAILSSHTLIEVITLLLPILAAMALREQFLRNNKVM